MDLATIDTGSTGTFTATGAITDSGTHAIAGAASFKTKSDAGAAVTLDFGTGTYGSLTLLARNAADTANAAGAISVTENAAMDLASVGTTSTGSFTSTGAITDSGTLTISSTSTFKTLSDAGAAITLDQAASTFGTLSLQARNAADGAYAGGAISALENAATDLGTSGTTSTFAITSKNAITDSGVITVTGTTSFITQNDTGGTGTITLDQASTFGSITARTLNDAGLSTVASNISIAESAAMDLALVDTGGTGTFTATGGAITDSGTLTITGTSTFKTLSDAGAAITLDQAASTFGTLSLQARNAADSAYAGGAISALENAATDLGTSGTTSTFAITSKNAITDSGVITASGATSFITQNDVAGTGTIALDQDSAFGAITARTLDNAGAATVASAIAIHEAAAMDLATVDTGSTGTFTSTGAMTDSGTLTISGATVFRTLSDAGAAITMDQTGSTFGALTVLSRNLADSANAGGALSVYEGAAMDLASVGTTGTFDAVATDAITDSGTITVGGATSFETRKDGGAAITLDQAASTFGALSLQSRNAADSANDAGNISVLENAAMDLLLVGTTGTFTAVATDAITDSGTLTVGG